jgi:hypothetical protein
MAEVLKSGQLREVEATWKIGALAGMISSQEAEYEVRRFLHPRSDIVEYISQNWAFPHNKDASGALLALHRENPREEETRPKFRP